jgi:formylglycine-generating enzyme required for sulfatase activity
MNDSCWRKVLWIGLLVTIFSVSRGVSTAEEKDMVLIPAGEFNMGSEDGDRDERPVHKVYLDAFYIDKYEVTNAQYRQFIKATGHRKPYGFEDDNFNQQNQPVVGVS